MRHPDECCEGNCKVSLGCYHDHCTGPGSFGPKPTNWTDHDEEARIKKLKKSGKYKDFKCVKD